MICTQFHQHGNAQLFRAGDGSPWHVSVNADFSICGEESEATEDSTWVEPQPGDRLCIYCARRIKQAEEVRMHFLGLQASAEEEAAAKARA